jgi:hypothetical protein
LGPWWAVAGDVEAAGGCKHRWRVSPADRSAHGDFPYQAAGWGWCCDLPVVGGEEHGGVWALRSCHVAGLGTPMPGTGTGLPSSLNTPQSNRYRMLPGLPGRDGGSPCTPGGPGGRVDVEAEFLGHLTPASVPGRLPVGLQDAAGILLGRVHPSGGHGVEAANRRNRASCCGGSVSFGDGGERASGARAARRDAVVAGPAGRMRRSPFSGMTLVRREDCVALMTPVGARES